MTKKKKEAEQAASQNASDEFVGLHFPSVIDIRGDRVNWGSVPFCRASDAEFVKYEINDGDIFVEWTEASSSENAYTVDSPSSVFALHFVHIELAARGIGRSVGNLGERPNTLSTSPDVSVDQHSKTQTHILRLPPDACFRRTKSQRHSIKSCDNSTCGDQRTRGKPKRSPPFGMRGCLDGCRANSAWARLSELRAMRKYNRFAKHSSIAQIWAVERRFNHNSRSQPMPNKKCRFAYVSLLSCVALFGSTPSTVANGKIPSLWLRGTLPVGNMYCDFDARIDPVLFSISTVAQKYNVIRVRCDNRTRRKIVLSDQKDKVTVFAGDTSVEAVIDLATDDPEAWESIPASVRKQIVYPTSIENGEEKDLLLFLPAGKLLLFTDEGQLIRVRIELEISSVNESVTLIATSATKK